MRSFVTAAAVGAAVLAAGSAIAQAAAQPAPAAAPPPAPYLGQARWPDAARILPPAPEKGSAREAYDMGAYRSMRKLEGSPRWALAQNDAPTGTPNMLANFSCAVGAPLTPQNAPRLNALLRRAGVDAGLQVASVKDVFKRPRPYQIEDGAVCVAKSPELGASPDYPSGHVTWGWLTGLILTSLAPDRATPILVRARAFGESRGVCGVHSPSAIEAGRTNGAALYAAMQGDPQFRADLDAARAEVAAARRAAPASAPPACAAEAELTARTPY